MATVIAPLTDLLTTRLSQTLGSPRAIIETCGYSRANDGGGATFRFASGESAGADRYTKINVANGQWQLVAQVRKDIRWFGGFPTVRSATVNVNGATVSGAAAGTWDSNCVGHKVLVEAPSESIGTVTVTNGSRIVSGTAFQTNIPAYDYDSAVPRDGGGLLINGIKCAILSIDSQTQLQLSQVWTGSSGSYTAYKELQHTSTIAAVNETGSGFTMQDAAPVAINGVQCDTGEPCQSALQALVTACNNGGTAYIPPGTYAVDGNSFWTLLTNVTIDATGAVFKDFRKASYQHAAVGDQADPTGLLTFLFCENIKIVSIGLDGSVPVDGFQMSSGFIDNGNGSGWRQGLVFRNCTKHYVEDLRDAGRGTRGEFFMSEGNNTVVNPATGEQYWNRDLSMRGCNVLRSNTNACNPNSGYLRRVSITNSTFRSTQWSAMLLSCRDGIVTGCTFAGDPSFDSRADLVVLDANAAEVLFAANIMQYANTTSWATGVLTIFGLGTNPLVKLSVKNNLIQNCTGGYQNSVAGVLKLNNIVNGVVSKLDMLNISAAATGGKYVYVYGSNNANLIVEDVYANAGTNMTIGVHVNTDVPNGVLTIRRCKFDGVTTPIYNPGNVRLKELIVEHAQAPDINAASYNAVLGFNVFNVVYSAGGISFVLWDPQITPGFEVTIVNSTAQTTTVTCGGSGTSVVGGSTLVGTGKCRKYKSNGSTWQCVANI